MPSDDHEHGTTADGARGTPKQEQPYSWVSKRATRRIRESGTVTSVNIALATYHALAEIASDEGSPTFQASKPYIARKAGLATSYRSVATALYELQKIGLIAIERRKLLNQKAHDVNRYTLCTVCTTVMQQTHDPHARKGGPSCARSRKNLSEGEKVLKEKEQENARAFSSGSLGSAFGSHPASDASGEKKEKSAADTWRKPAKARQ